MMKKTIQSLIVVIMSVMVLVGVSGCSTLNPLDVFSKPKIETNIGENVKKEESVLSLQQGSTEQTADKISNDTNAEVINQITQNIPMNYLLIMILLAGWVIPSPKECYNGLKWLSVDLYDSLIRKPIIGIMNFILLLLGREKM